MTYSFTQDVPIGTDTYERMRQGLGEDLPDGLVVHVAMELPEGGLRYLEVWESEEAWDRFQEERLHPVVHPIVEEVLGFLPPEPERTPAGVFHVWGAGVPV